ncbi:hypothetical protein PROFUN_10164 [Planoprotostelium fungivorum]|uniref:ZFYVE26-like TPR repeats domain-containing protein n=1 Tax=Planoprotostelium fungivorum TaxID=1890364 RepID=A0A2P6NEK4_9EUKA|nr:hypothetical protein PROFUN_10164 [Planoprotostelium fungivorum]
MNRDAIKSKEVNGDVRRLLVDQLMVSSPQRRRKISSPSQSVSSSGQSTPILKSSPDRNSIHLPSETEEEEEEDLDQVIAQWEDYLKEAEDVEHVQLEGMPSSDSSDPPTVLSSSITTNDSEDDAMNEQQVLGLVLDQFNDSEALTPRQSYVFGTNVYTSPVHVLNPSSMFSRSSSSVSSDASDSPREEVNRRGRTISATVPRFHDEETSVSPVRSGGSTPSNESDILHLRREQLERKMKKGEEKKEKTPNKLRRRSSVDNSNLNQYISQSPCSRLIFEKLLEPEMRDKGNPFIGIRVLLMISPERQEQMYHLIRFPDLIVENLIMMEYIDEAGCILRQYPELITSTKLLQYARKALDFREDIHLPPQLDNLMSDAFERCSFRKTSKKRVSADSISTITGGTFWLNYDYIGHWDAVLTGYIEQDESIRSSHFFNSGHHNLHLSLSILKLGKSSKLGQHLIDFCDLISGDMNQKREGQKMMSGSAEVMLVNAMNRIISEAKLFFASNEHMDRGRESLCDSYLCDIELMKRLQGARLNLNYSLLELTDKNKVRYLRDLLIQGEEYEISLYVCSRYSLDREPVWTAWGMHCLRSGDHSQAHDKFKHALSSPKTSRQEIDTVLKNILSILDFLPQKETTVSKEKDRRSSFRMNREEVVNKSPDTVSRQRASPKVGGASDVWSPERESLFQECIYYLTEYGTPTLMNKFLIHWKRYKELCVYSINRKQVTPQWFANDIVHYFITQNNIPELLQAVFEADPEMQHSWDYLLACCNCLNSKDRLEELLSFQVAMKDWGRAGLTCIKAYVKSDQFIQKDQFLERAKTYFTRQLDSDVEPTQGTGMMAKADLHKYIKRVNLQQGIIEALGQTETTSKLSVFGSSSQRCQIAEALLLQDFIDLGVTVMVSFKLPTRKIILAAVEHTSTNDHLKLMRKIVKRARPMMESEEDWDSLVHEVIDKLLGQGNNKEAESWISSITSEEGRIDALIRCGKLKSAYLLAVKTANVQKVVSIRDEAKTKNYMTELRLAEQYLSLMQNGQTE